MNAQTILAKHKITTNRELVISKSIIETGNKRTIGIDIRKYNQIKDGSFVPTQKGIFLTYEELKFLVSYLGFDFSNIRPEISEFLLEKEEKIGMLA